MSLNLGVNSPAQSRGVVLPTHKSLQATMGTNSNGTPYWLCQVYNGTGGALVANRPYLITFAGASALSENPRVTALAAQTGVQNHIVIAHDPIPDGQWGLVCYQGYHDCGVEGTTDVSAGDYLLVSAGVSTTGLVKDGTSRTSQSCAIAMAAQASNSVVDTRVFLFGGPALTSLTTSVGALSATTGTFTGVVLGPAGAVGAPTFSFSGDPDTGIYNTGTNSLGLAAGGSLIVSVDANSRLLFQDAINIQVQTTTGTKIGTATGQKIGFWNATPVVQQSGGTQTFSTAESTHAARTALVLTDSTGGSAGQTIANLADGTTYANDHAAIENNFASLTDEVNKLIADLADTASYLNFVVDQLQVLGLLA